MRPESSADNIGQQHLLAAGKPLPRVSSRAFTFYDPLGATGYRQQNAEAIARDASADVERIPPSPLA
ncbi:hypothetical protein ACLB1M_09245 [Escherichia coli]